MVGYAEDLCHAERDDPATSPVTIHNHARPLLQVPAPYLRRVGLRVEGTRIGVEGLGAIGYGMWGVGVYALGREGRSFGGVHGSHVVKGLGFRALVVALGLCARLK